jgi:hypothetical protein
MGEREQGSRGEGEIKKGKKKKEKRKGRRGARGRGYF